MPISQIFYWGSKECFTYALALKKNKCSDEKNIFGNKNNYNDCR